LIAAVYDDVDNTAQDTVQIDVTEAGSEGAFRITNPFEGQTIEKAVPAYSIAIEVPNASDLATLRVTAQNLWTGETTLVGETVSPAAITTITWTLPATAQYSLTASATTNLNGGSTLVSPPILVYVKEPSAPSGLPVEAPAPTTP
jgi:hypothetical protein